MSVSQLTQSTIVPDMEQELMKELSVKHLCFLDDRERNDAVQRAGRLFHCLTHRDENATQVVIRVLHRNDTPEFLCCVSDVIDVYLALMPSLFDIRQVGVYMTYKVLMWRL